MAIIKPFIGLEEEMARTTDPAGPLERLAYRKHEVANALGVSMRTIDRWVSDGRIQAVKVGQTWLIDPASVRTLLTREGDAYVGR